ncbi:MAG TPA: 4Fe-4S binding protein [Planctomycetota bacterium]|nr:4Fe-4S binding protein [Planctomycetota bacterium]
MSAKQESRINLWRRITQAAFVLLLNPYFFTYRQVCFPVLNCWGCPVSAFACPVGALGQFFAHGVFPFIVLGTIVFFGALMGRMLCGWVCPFGFIQDLLYKIPGRKLNLPAFLKYGKYAALVIMVILIPLLVGIDLTPGKTTGQDFFFCRLCPAGTFEAYMPLSIMSADAKTAENAPAISQQFTEGQSADGQPVSFCTLWLKSPRFWILIAFIVLFVLISRPFCRAVCPIGAMFALLNKFSIYKLAIDKTKCIECDVCYKICPSNNKVQNNPNSSECIRCLACQAKCPTEAIENKYF